MKLDQINEIVMRGDVCEGRSIAALYMAREWLAGRLATTGECPL